MNKIDVLLGNNPHILFEESIKYIGNFLNDFTKENIVIVPDRLSLLTEKNIFSLLNIDVYFNLSVMGISKFVKNIIKSNGLEFLECSTNQSKLLTLKAIQNTKNNFKCFSKNYTLGLVDEIYAKIEQIKSSNANIDDLIDEKASVGTKLKYEDIKLIYNEYEKLRGDRLDSGALLSVFNNTCSDSTNLKNYNIFFIGFDSMTKQGIETIKNVTKYCHNTFVAICHPKNQDNYKMYDTTFFDSIKNMANVYNFEININTLNIQSKNKAHNIILNNIFTRKTHTNINNYVNIYKANTIQDEIDFLVKSINYNLKTKDIMFKDIAICCPTEYSEKIKSKLNDIQIQSHNDNKQSLINLEPIKYLLNYIKYLSNPHDKTYLFKIIFNDFFDATKEQKEIFFNLLNQYSSTNSIINNCKNLNEEIKLLINNLIPLKINKSDKLENYLKNIKNIIINCNFYKKIANFCEFLKSKNEIHLEKTYLQIEKKLTNIFDEIEDTLGETSLTYLEFIDILENILTNNEISGIPCTINEILIGDTKSYFGNIKYLYIVGANEGNFPEILQDCGLITDTEINSDSIKTKLEPTTKIINKRNKFKALQTILSATEKCYLCFHSIGRDQRPVQPSEFISELKYLFNINEIDISSFVLYDENHINTQKLCFNNVNYYNANLNSKLENLEQVSMLISSTLIKDKKIYFRPLISKNATNYKTLFFKTNKASISLIEKYNRCPMSAFLANGLKLQKNKQDKIEANIIGSFIHEVAEIFVKNNKQTLGSLTEKIIEQSVKQICNQLLENDCYYSIKLEENKFIYNLIEKECIRFCLFLNYEQTISEFKPAYTEKYFGPNSTFSPIQIKVEDTYYNISGFVDRIDICEDYFRVIDYKSGNPNFKNLKDGLFYGTKLQLFVYAEAINQNIDKKLFGAFYLPIQNTFTSEKGNDYSYMGFFIDSVSLAKKCDKTLTAENLKSNLLGCSFNKPKPNSELVFRKNDNIITPEQMESFKKYAIKIVENSIKNIQDGFIDAMPIKDNCNHCEFKNICKFAENKNITRDLSFTLTNENFLEIKYE